MCKSQKVVAMLFGGLAMGVLLLWHLHLKFDPLRGQQQQLYKFVA